MRLRFWHWLTLLSLSVLIVPAHGAEYEITTTADTRDQSECSIRNALEAIKTQQAVGACEAGDENNSILLREGETYSVDCQKGNTSVDCQDSNGDPQSLPVSRVDSDGNNKNVTVRFVLAGDFDEEDDPANAVLDGNGDSRVLTVASNASVSLSNMTLRNGDVTSRANDDGGLVYLNQGSSLGMNEGSRLEQGEANRGGLIYADAAAVVIQGESALNDGHAVTQGGAAFLVGPSTFQMNTSSIKGNTSAGSGGALAVAPDFNGGFSFTNSYIADNAAGTTDDEAGTTDGGDGGALYLPDLDPASSGNDSVSGALFIENTTIAGNSAIEGSSASGSGGALFWDQQQDTDNDPNTDDNDTQAISINNMTVANNSSGSGASVYIAEAPTNSNGEATVGLVNSVIVGDQDQDGSECAGAAFSSVDMTKEYNVLGDGCSPTGTNKDATSGGQDSIEALANDDGRCASSGCEPAELEPFPGYLPATYQNIDCDKAGPDTAFCAGSPPGQGDSCLPSDQRGISRLKEERCDAGAIQFQTAVGQEDEIEIISGQKTILNKSDEKNFIQNDLGDASVDCGRVGGIEDCIETVFPPERPEASIEFRESEDKPGYPVAVYDPGSDYHGLDRFAYRIDSGAFEATKEGRDVQAEVNIVAQPESGLQESDSIEHIGSSSWLGLGLMALVGLFRRQKFYALFLFLLVPVSHAAEIEVDAFHDKLDRNDGVCSIREAVYSSRDDTVNPYPACADGADGEDTIILPRGCITLTQADRRGPLQVEDGITIRGEGAHGIDSSSIDPTDPTKQLVSNVCGSENSDRTEGTIIQGGGETRILENNAGMTISGVTLVGGRAVGRNGGAIRASAGLSLEEVEFFDNEANLSGGVGGRGGAIFLVGFDSSDESQQLSIRNGYFLDNSADLDGGAITMQSGTGYSLEIIDSTFERNHAKNGAGGALRMIGNDGTSWIVNTTLINNLAEVDDPGEIPAAAGAIDLQGLATSGSSSGVPKVNMVNNTIVDNEGQGPGAINVGPDQDGSGSDLKRDFTLTNSVLTNNSNNSCYISSSEAEPFNRLMYNLIPDNNDDGTGMDTCFTNQYPANTCDNQNNTNECATDSDIRASLASQAAYTEGEGADEFIPPNIEVLSGAALIRDAGNDSELASSDFGDLALCRPQDVRGFTRESGSQCDRGAFEIQETTAVNDSGSGEVLRENGKIFIDVLANDFTDPASRRIDPTSIQVSESPNLPGGTAVVYKNFRSVECVGHANVSQEVRDRNPDVDFDEEDCVILYDPARPDPLDENSGPENIGCADLPREYQEDSLGAAFEYKFESVALNDNSDREKPDDPGKVFLTVENIAPVIQSETVWNKPGEKVVIDLDIEDPFAPEGTPRKIDYSSFELESAPEFADVNESGDIVGTGIKFNEPRKGQITYVPRDKTKRFTDRFSISVADNFDDECESKKRSAGASMVIRYPDEDVSGGEMLGGSIGVVWLMALVGFGGVRRRFRVSAQPRL